jgi:probable HAF family extracellular repeat protein
MFTSRSVSVPVSVRAASRLAAFAAAILLSACGGGGDHHDPVPPSQPERPASIPMYDVIPLGTPDAWGDITRRGIANGGIVAGTSWGGPGGTAQAFLYNGKTEVALGTLGGNFSQVWAVNRCGRVTGWSGRADGLAHAFFYDGAMHDLGTLGGSESSGEAINNCGKTTGWAVTASGQTHAFLYDGATMRDLGSLGGASYGLAINNVGQIVGQAFGPGNAWFHPFLYDSRTGGPMQDLGVLGESALAVDINDAGQVVGWWRVREGVVRGFFYEAGVMRDVGTLGGAYSEFMDINERGLAVGNSELAEGGQRGFVYDGKAMKSIGSLNGSLFSEAVAVNADGLVVGSSVTPGPGGEQHAISWTAKEGIVDLNQRMAAPPAGLVLIKALAVADDGNIAVRTNRGLALLKLRR